MKKPIDLRILALIAFALACVAGALLADSLTPTAAAAPGALSGPVNWFHVVISFIVGLFTIPAVKKATAGVTPQEIAGVAKTADALAPVAEEAATLAGQPALAAGIAAVDKGAQILEAHATTAGALADAHTATVAALQGAAVAPADGTVVPGK